MKSITHQLKRFANDERAVSPVVGFVLIFALVMIVFTIYQADVVPAQNKEVEFKHSQTVEDEMSRLNDAIQEAGTSGVPQSATVATGVQYPDRVLGINPGAPAGSIYTSDPFAVEINNLETKDGHWDGISGPNSRQVIYETNYNLYQSEPRIVIENGLLYKQFDNADIVDSAGIVSGTTINLQLINGSASGEYQESSSSATISPVPQSASREYLNVSPSGGTPTLRLETTLSRQAWENTLGTDFSGVDGTEEYARVAGYAGSDPATVTIELKSGQNYDLRITEIGFQNVEKSPYYLTREDRQDRTTGSDETETFVVSARDEFGNPVSNTKVTLSGITAPGMVTASSATTDENGRATLTYEQKGQGGGEIEFEIGPNSREQVTYNINRDQTDGKQLFTPNELFEDVGSISQIRVKDATPVVIDGCRFDTDAYNATGASDVSSCEDTPTLEIDFRVDPDSGNDYRGLIVLQDIDRNGNFNDGNADIALVRFVEIKSGNNKVLAEGELNAQAANNLFDTSEGTNLLDANNYATRRLGIAPPSQTKLNSGKIRVNNADLIISDIRGRAVVELN